MKINTKHQNDLLELCSEDGRAVFISTTTLHDYRCIMGSVASLIVGYFGVEEVLFVDESGHVLKL
jgi:hypothetical protein